MITFVNAPTAQSNHLDANPVVISFNSDTVAETYFEVEIKIDEVSFTKRSIAMDEDGNASFKFQHFYDDYFSNPLTIPLATGIQSFNSLRVKVDFIVREYLIADDTLQAINFTPSFYLLKSISKDTLDDRYLKVIGFNSTQITIEENGIVTLPLYHPKGTFRVKLITQNGTVLLDISRFFYLPTLCRLSIFLETVVGLLPGDYSLVLSPGTTKEIIILLRVVEDTAYEVKKCWYSTNNGIFVVANLFGIEKSDLALSPQSYTNQNGELVTYQVDKTQNIAINTGYHYKTQSALTQEVAASIEPYLWIDEKWTRVISQTKKTLIREDRTFVYDDTLLFTLSK